MSTEVSSHLVGTSARGERVSREHLDARYHRIIVEASTLAAQGYERCRMRMVATNAGLALSTVYLYFPSKDELLLACLRHWLDDHDDVLRPDTFDRSTRARYLTVACALLHEVTRVPRLADAMVRPYLCARGVAAERAEVIRRQVTDVFLRATPSTGWEAAQPWAELFTDVCMTNVLAITQRRCSVEGVLRSLSCAASSM